MGRRPGGGVPLGCLLSWHSLSTHMHTQWEARARPSEWVARVAHELGHKIMRKHARGEPRSPLQRRYWGHIGDVGMNRTFALELLPQSLAAFSKKSYTKFGNDGRDWEFPPVTMPIRSDIVLAFNVLRVF